MIAEKDVYATLKIFNIWSTILGMEFIQKDKFGTFKKSNYVYFLFGLYFAAYMASLFVWPKENSTPYEENKSLVIFIMSSGSKSMCFLAMISILLLGWFYSKDKIDIFKKLNSVDSLIKTIGKRSELFQFNKKIRCV